tara:strand:+ start:17652 stop:18026 length:375 start_codon:yes stop_codon:yes gene_type:complete
MFKEHVNLIIDSLRFTNFSNYDYNFDYINLMYFENYYIIHSYLIAFMFTIINNLYIHFMMSYYIYKIERILDSKLTEFSKKIKCDNISDNDNDNDSDSDSDSDSDDTDKPVIKRNPKRKCRRVY